MPEALVGGYNRAKISIHGVHFDNYIDKTCIVIKKQSQGVSVDMLNKSLERESVFPVIFIKQQTVTSLPHSGIILHVRNVILRTS